MSIKLQHEAIIEFLDLAPSIKGKSIIDVGCGDGFASVNFLDRGASYVSVVDPISSGSLLPDGIRFYKDVNKVKESYDILWCHHVLEHIESPIQFLRDFSKLSNELWLSVPVQTDVFSLGHIISYTGPILCEHLKRAGWNVKDASYRLDGSHLRVRIIYGESDYPEPMKKSLDKIGKCPGSILNNWNWRVI